MLALPAMSSGQWYRSRSDSFRIAVNSISNSGMARLRSSLESRELHSNNRKRRTRRCLALQHACARSERLSRLDGTPPRNVLIQSNRFRPLSSTIIVRIARFRYLSMCSVLGLCGPKHRCNWPVALRNHDDARPTSSATDEPRHERTVRSW